MYVSMHSKNPDGFWKKIVFIPRPLVFEEPSGSSILVAQEGGHHGIR